MKEKGSETKSLKGAARTTTLSQGIFALSKSAIGAGALSLPNKMAQLGLASGMGMLFFASAMCTTTLHFLSRIAAATDLNSYFAMGKLAFGGAGELAAMITLILNIIGALIFYVAVAGKYLSSFLGFLTGSTDSWYTNPTYMMIVTAIAVFPVACQRDMSALAKASIVGMVCMFYILFLTIFDYFYDSATSAAASIEVVKGFSFELYMKMFSGILFAFVNHFTMVSTVPSMVDPTPKRRTILTMGSGSLVLVFYSVLALMGYLHFGSTVDKNILLASSTESAGMRWAYAIGQLLMGIVLILSYPLLLDPARGTMEQAIAMIRGVPNRPSQPISIAITASIITVSALVAINFLDSAMSILDIFTASTGSLLVFIYPAGYFLKLSSKYKVHAWERMMAYASLVLGLIVCVFGTFYSVMDLF